MKTKQGNVVSSKLGLFLGEVVSKSVFHAKEWDLST